MPEVKILSEIPLMIYPTPDRAEQVIAVTYQTGFMPPRTIYVKQEDHTEDNVRKAIKADIDKAATAKPKTMEV